MMRDINYQKRLRDCSADLIFIDCGETENPYLEIVKANKAEVLI